MPLALLRALSWGSTGPCRHQYIQEDMFIAALVLSALGFILLVVTVTTPSEIWTWLLIITVVAGLVCFLIGESRARRHQGRGHRPPLDEWARDQHQDAR